MTEFARILRLLADALNQAGIPFAVGGSVASSVRGVYRATNDIDIVAGIDGAKVEQFVAALGADWCADADQMRSAIAAGRSFNLIYLPTIYKVDVFPAVEEFHFSQLQRATSWPETAECPVATAEDIILAKLRWYSDAGEISERQWSDIVNVVAMNPDLDRQYMELWAPRLGVTRLLAKALADPGREP
jgi:hypothetical protein